MAATQTKKNDESTASSDAPEATTTEESKDEVKGRVKKGDPRFRSLGKKVRTQRASHGMAQAKLAEALVNPKSGVPWHYTYVGNVERGLIAPSQDFLNAVAKHFDINVEDLLPSGVSLTDLPEGVTRARRGQGKARLARLAREKTTTSEATPQTRRSTNSGGTVGIASDGKSVTITLNQMQFTMAGAFDASIVNGRLRVG